MSEYGSHHLFAHDDDEIEQRLVIGAFLRHKRPPPPHLVVPYALRRFLLVIVDGDAQIGMRFRLKSSVEVEGPSLERVIDTSRLHRQSVAHRGEAHLQRQHVSRQQVGQSTVVVEHPKARGWTTTAEMQNVQA